MSLKAKQSRNLEVEVTTVFRLLGVPLFPNKQMFVFSLRMLPGSGIRKKKKDVIVNKKLYG